MTTLTTEGMSLAELKREGRALRHVTKKQAVEPSENQFQAAVVKALRKYEAVGLLRVVAVPNGGKRRPREAAQMKNRGVIKGFPDLMLFFPAVRRRVLSYPPRVAFLELKAGSGALKIEQIDWKAWLTRSGFAHYEIRTMREVEEVLANYGIQILET